MLTLPPLVRFLVIFTSLLRLSAPADGNLEEGAGHVKNGPFLVTLYFTISCRSKEDEP